MQKQYRLAHDPIFYIMLAFFALLTTALPASLGQPRFMPVVQTLALFVFLLVPLRQGLIRQAVNVMIIWLLIQLLVILVLTWLVPLQLERAIGDGFLYRSAYLQWFFGRGIEPDSLWAQPGNRLIELAGVIIGSLATGGLLGVWFLVRAVNLTGFSMGALIAPLGGFSHLLGALPLWTLVRLAGYAGAVIYLAEPLLTSNWSLRYYGNQRRQFLLVVVGLLCLGFLLEFLLPGVWRTLFAPPLPRK